MTRPTCWWWIRHAPVPGSDGRINGHRDVACDVSEAAAFATLAGRLPAEAVYVISPLRRTHQTLDAIMAAGAPVAAALVVEPDFAEQNFGAWEGLAWAEMQALDPEVYARFWTDPTRNAPPGGESFASQMRRVAAGIERLTAAHLGRDIVSVSHGGSIRAAVALALRLAPEQAMAIVVDNLSLTRLARVEQGFLRGGRAWMVHGVNVPCRWSEPPPAAKA